MTATAASPTHHLVIAGTGRAGTSFLVRYLTELGLDTSLSRQGEAAFWDEAANAGLEEFPIVGSGATLPYVVKSPWTGDCIEQVLANPQIAIDALVLPVRDLVEAATSRAVLEMRAIHQRAPWMAELDRSWEVWADTPGGVIYSLNPLDQARLLAVGFHAIVQHAAEAEIPIIFLAFPRMIGDCGYLYRTLRPVLPPEATTERARAAHARVADRGKVRVGDELAGAADRGERPAGSARRQAVFPLPAAVDRLALQRELARLREALRRTLEQAEQAADEAGRLRAALAASEAARIELASVAEEQVKQGREAAQRASDGEKLLHGALAEAEVLKAGLAAAERACDALAAARSSRTWRAFAPLRAVLGAVKRIAGAA